MAATMSQYEFEVVRLFLKEAKTNVKELYSLIPDVPCIEGCHECCKHFNYEPTINFDRVVLKDFCEENNIQRKENSNGPCQYLGKNGCKIYLVRPIECRLYGTTVSKRFGCRVGVMPINPLTDEKFIKVHKKYYEVTAIG